MSAIDKVAAFWRKVHSGQYASTRAMQNAIGAMRVPESMKVGLRQSLIAYVAAHGPYDKLVCVEYLVCAHNRNVHAITVNGTRITPARGTGEWRCLQSWHIKRIDLLDAINGETETTAREARP